MVKLRGRGRIKYTNKEDQPSILIAGEIGRILNISQTGVKFKGSIDLELPEGVYIELNIDFQTQDSVENHAQLVRQIGDLFSLVFKKKIPKHVIEHEAMLLLNKYGSVDIS